eukprot:2036134-Rhodomonas_salina.1
MVRLAVAVSRASMAPCDARNCPNLLAASDLALYLQLGIADVQLSMSTLEDVFLGVAAQARARTPSEHIGPYLPFPPIAI